MATQIALIGAGIAGGAVVIATVLYLAARPYLADTPPESRMADPTGPDPSEYVLGAAEPSSWQSVAQTDGHGHG